jgi:hypothetical protein
VDAKGYNLSSPNIQLTALRLQRVNADGSRTTVTLQDVGNSNPGNRYDAGPGGYMFNLSGSSRGTLAGPRHERCAESVVGQAELSLRAAKGQTASTRPLRIA